VSRIARAKPAGKGLSAPGGPLDVASPDRPAPQMPALPPPSARPRPPPHAGGLSPRRPGWHL